MRKANDAKQKIEETLQELEAEILWEYTEQRFTIAGYFLGGEIVIVKTTCRVIGEVSGVEIFYQSEANGIDEDIKHLRRIRLCDGCNVRGDWEHEAQRHTNKDSTDERKDKKII